MWMAQGLYVVLKFTTAQPQKIAPLRKETFPACPVEFPEGNPIQQGLSSACWFGVGDVARAG